MSVGAVISPRASFDHVHNGNAIIGAELALA
jgi:hypothetical protein